MVVKRAKASLKTQDARRQLMAALDADELLPMPKHPKSITALDTSLGQILASQASAQRLAQRRKVLPLRTLTAQVLAHNADALPLDVLAQFDWPQVSHIWEVIKEEMLDSLGVFAKFATAFPNDFTYRKILHVSLQDLISALAKIAEVSVRMLRRMSVPRSPAWALHLDFSHVAMPEETLLQLGTMPGLRILKINDSGLHDRTVKHWARSQSTGGFASLLQIDIRSNMFTNVDYVVTILASFTKLRLLRCDATPLWHFNALPEMESLRALWQRGEDFFGPVIDLRTHYGSRADERPLSLDVDDVIIDLARLRARHTPVQLPIKSQAAQLKTVARTARKKQKWKNRVDQDALWHQIL